MSTININPTVSIIIPTWNRAALICETIESVRGQSYTNWELIIVDDGSDDNTGSVVEQFQDPRIQFIRCERTGIGGKVRNTGIAFATGELIAFTDSDDLWHPGKLEQQVTALLLYPCAGFSLTNGFNFRNPGKPVDFFFSEKKGTRSANIFEDLFCSRVAAFTQTLLFRKECLTVSGLFKESKAFSDIDFIISLAQYFTAVILYEPLVYRRLHHSNYITDNWEKSYWEGIEVIQEYRPQLPASVAKNALFRVYMNFGEKCLSNHQSKKSIGKFLKGWQYKPFSIIPLKKTGKALLSFLDRK